MEVNIKELKLRILALERELNQKNLMEFKILEQSSKIIDKNYKLQDKIFELEIEAAIFAVPNATIVSIIILSLYGLFY